MLRPLHASHSQVLMDTRLAMCLAVASPSYPLRRALGTHRATPSGKPRLPSVPALWSWTRPTHMCRSNRTARRDSGDRDSGLSILRSMRGTSLNGRSDGSRTSRMATSLSRRGTLQPRCIRTITHPLCIGSGDLRRASLPMRRSIEAGSMSLAAWTCGAAGLHRPIRGLDTKRGDADHSLALRVAVAEVVTVDPASEHLFVLRDWCSPPVHSRRSNPLVRG